ncbi:ThiJ/PfpI family protein [Apiospora arundinis]
MLLGRILVENGPAGISTSIVGKGAIDSSNLHLYISISLSSLESPFDDADCLQQQLLTTEFPTEQRSSIRPDIRRIDDPENAHVT